MEVEDSLLRKWQSLASVKLKLERGSVPRKIFTYVAETKILMIQSLTMNRDIG